MSKAAAARDGQPQHQTKVVVVGASGKEAADAIGRHRAQLEHFQSAEQQRLLLSPEGVDIHRGYASWPGAHAVYTNSYGQETIVLTLKPEGEEHEEPKTNPAFWDYVLIEIEVPAGNSSYAEFSAWLESDKPDPIYALDDASHEGSADNILRYPDGENKPVPTVGPTTADTHYKASLLVDLRGFQHEGAAAKVDLHGRLKPYVTVGLPTDPHAEYTILHSSPTTRWRVDLDVPGVYGVFCSPDTFTILQNTFPAEMASTTRNPTITQNYYLAPGTTDSGYNFTQEAGSFTAVPNWRTTDFAPGGVVYQPAGWTYSYSDTPPGHTIPGDDPDVYMGMFASSYFNGVTDYWPGTTIAKLGKREGSIWTNSWDGSTGQDAVPHPPPQPATSFSIGMYDQLLLYIPVCKITGKVQAKLRYVFVKGDPFDQKSRHSVSIPDGTPPDDYGTCSYFQWETSKRSDRLPMREVKKGPLVPITDKTGTTSLANRFQLPKMGSVTINPLRGQETVSYKAA